MAGTLSHFKLMQDLEKKLDIDNKDLFLMAGQGHDLLFFVRLRDLNKFGMRSDIAKDIASQKFKVLIECWQEEVINTNNKELETMLYGYIAHHIMDYYIHPWINKDLGYYFDPLYVKIKKTIHEEKVKEIREENKRKRDEK